MTIRENGRSHIHFIPSRRRLPLRGSLSSAFGAPLLQGATPLACKSADPSQGLLPHIVISSVARNLPCTTVKRRASDEEQPKHPRDFIITSILSLPHKYRVPLRRKRSLGFARDDDTREWAISHYLSFLHIEGCPCGAVYPPPSACPFFKGLLSGKVFRKPDPRFHFSIGANLRPFGAPPSMGRRENAASQTPHGEGNDTRMPPPPKNKKYRQVSLTVSDLYPHHVVKAGF